MSTRAKGWSAPVESEQMRYKSLFDVVVRSLRRQAEERELSQRVDEREADGTANHSRCG